LGARARCCGAELGARPSSCRQTESSAGMEGTLRDVTAGGIIVGTWRGKDEEQRGSPMLSMFRIFPLESAIVMQRGIELGVACNCFLASHCALLIREYRDTTATFDRLLLWACMIRLLLMAPRPIYWIRTWRLFVDARQQPTPKLVAQRLVDIYAHPFAKERCLLIAYYAWLICCFVVLSLWMLCEGIFYDTLVFRLWRHCAMSFAGICLHRLACVSLFSLLVNRNSRQGEAAEALDKYTKKVWWFGALFKLGGFSGGTCDGMKWQGSNMNCSICLGCFALGQRLRVLRCGHYFHCACVDTWLLRHRNSCPLCLLVVGPTASVAG